MENYRDKYIFIVATFGASVYDYIYRDINDLKYAAFDHGPSLPPILKILMRGHLSLKVNRILPMPFRDIWGKIWIRQWKQKIEEMQLGDRIPCFIFLSSVIPFEKFGLSQNIRKEFPKAKIVYFYSDLINLDPNKQELMHSGIADLICTFDPGDAEKYHLPCFNLPYSKLRQNYPKQSLEYDICFIGKAKDRLGKILDAYTYFSSQGLRCRFYVTHVPAEQQKYADKICYCDTMEYESYLQKISKAKCILEIMQEGGCGNTVRVSEAVEFDKILITNNRGILDNELYDSRYMFLYDEVTNIDCDKIRHTNCVHYEIRDLLSTEKYLEAVAEALENNNGS